MTALADKLLDLPVFIRGKVRDVYDLGGKLLMVSSDRISAYDSVLPTMIPDKGKILNQISEFWFNRTKVLVDNHLVTANVDEYPPELQRHRTELAGRSMMVWKTRKIPIECVVRGYLAGSGWKEYQSNGKVCGVSLPPGLKESQKLPEPIFTPATKEEGGKHDENISFEKMASRIGKELSQELKSLSLLLYREAEHYLSDKKLVLADTKFEFGLRRINGETKAILIDECMTPDSSRFWEFAEYKVGISPPSFDKQFVRNYLDTVGWDHNPPAPSLPSDIVDKTRAKYLEAYRRVTGREEL